MISDWHTIDGREKLAVGLLFEERLFRKLQRLDGEAVWKSREGGDALYVGWDMMFRGQKIEVKSNEGANWRGVPYDTVCVELVTKAGRRVGWRSGGADIVALINRAKRECYLYRAAALSDFLEGKQRIVVHNAECVKMRWNEGEFAGFIKKISLDLE